ncbi:MAG: glycosyltransferase family 2 protein [Anaerolineales bacterium]
MKQPMVSVVIPAYNNARFLGETIESVLDQTYQNFELIIVNDASPDDILAVVERYPDSRIQYIVHGKNLGLSAARNTGTLAAEGEIIAHLDGDDLYHPQKLQKHVEFLERHPQIGVSYNSRFELNHSATTIREIWRPPRTVDLSDLVLGFPFGPSDMLIRRHWARKVLFDESYTFFGEDLDINCQLALAGCTFASVDSALNYRRYHAGRVKRDIRACQEEETRPLYAVFNHSQCPQNVLSLRDEAFANRYVFWAFVAFVQIETDIGQEYFMEAIRLNPSLMNGNPSSIIENFRSLSILDESQNHKKLLTSIFEQLPVEVDILREQLDLAVAIGYLLKGVRAIIWGRIEDGESYFDQAAAYHTSFDDYYLGMTAAQLQNYEREFGSEAVKAIMPKLTPQLKKIFTYSQLRRFNSLYLFNQAFQYYQAGDYLLVPKIVMNTLFIEPKYLANRGVLKILSKSILKSLVGQNGHKNIGEY